MTDREDVLTISFGDLITIHTLISREVSEDAYEYYLFNKIKILSKKRDKDKEERRFRRSEFRRLNRQKICMEDFYSKDYKANTEDYLLITVSFNNPVVVDYQIKLIKKYLKGNFVHIICDNSNRIEAAREIKNVCIQNDTTYIRINSKTIPNGYSDSHGVALNWVWNNVIKSKQKDFGLLDHDIFPIVEQNVTDYFNKNQDFWGQIRFKNNNNHKERWFLWPGFAFYKFDAVKDLNLNFRRYKHFGFIKAKSSDTGSANWRQLYSRYNADELEKCTAVKWDLRTNAEFCGKWEANTDFEYCIDYFNNKTWLHAVNGSDWHASKGKINLVYEELTKYV